MTETTLAGSPPGNHVATFREEGSCVLRGLFSADEAAAMARFDLAALRRFAAERPGEAHRLQTVTREDGHTTIQKIEGISRVAPAMARWCTDPRLLDLAGALMGEPAVLFKDKYILKPRGGGGFPPHQDMTMGFHRFVSGVVSLMIALDPADRDNGCLQLAPIRHTPSLVSRPEMPLDPRLVPEDAWRDVPLAPGDVAAFDGLTPHRSAPNESDRLRRVWIVTFAPAADGDRYDDYYRWYFAWQAHGAAGGQREDYPGDPPRRSRPDVRSFTRWAGESGKY